MHTIRPKALIKEVMANMRSRLNTMIWGGPGTGKSEIPQQIAESLGQPLLDFRANLFDPVDVRGVPYVAQMSESKKRFTRWAVPDVFPVEERDGATGIFLIDELPTAPPATQNAFLQLLLTRVIGNYRLPDGWSIIAAGNRLTDAAAVYQMPSPVRNRLSHYELEPHIDDWCDWAIGQQVDPSIVSYLRYRPGSLYNFNPESYAFPTPRSWAFVDKRLRDSRMDEETLYYGVSSLVGDGAASEYMSFRKIYKDLPDIDYLLDNPQTYARTDEPSLMYALTGALAARAEDARMDKILKIVDKLPVEFQVVAIKGCIAQDNSVLEHTATQKWVTDNANVIL